MKERFEEVDDEIEDLGQEAEEAEAVVIGLALRGVISNSLVRLANLNLSLQAAVNLLW